MIITDKAVTHVLSRMPTNMKALRISIQAGGCSGFSKVMNYTADIQADDTWVGTCVVLDPETAQILSQATLDHELNLSGDKLVLQIPEASTQCGCGRSFDF
jgi:iron-sulfur cluster assembly protein